MSETGGNQLLGTKEAAALYGVKVPNFVRDWASRPDFPAPVERLSRGRVWRREDLEAYKAVSGPRRGVRAGKLRLSPAARQWLPVIKRRIVRGFDPERIILFGSQARGEASADSDIDLIVVQPEVTDPRAAAARVRASLRGVPLPKDILVMTPERLADEADLIGSVVRSAVREGVTIYAHG